MRDLLLRVRETSLEAFDHQEVPFELLVSKLRPRWNLGALPLFQVMFNLLHDPLPPLDLPFIQADLVELDRGASAMDLTLNLRVEGAELRGSLEYSTELFDEDTVEAMLETSLPQARRSPWTVLVVFSAIPGVMVLAPMCTLTVTSFNLVTSP